MAISLINSQGTQVWIVSPVCAHTALLIQAGDLVGCPQSIGNIDQSRAVTEYKCMSSNDSAKALGSIERGNVEIGLLFDPTDVAGQDALKTAWLANETVTVGIELPDTLGTNGTIFAFDGGISNVSIGIETDSAITYTVTIEIGSDVTEIAAAV